MFRMGVCCGSADKESACNAGNLDSVPGLGRSPGEGKSDAIQCSGLENSMGCIVHGITKSWTRLSSFHSLTRKVIHFPGQFIFDEWKVPTFIHYREIRRRK